MEEVDLDKFVRVKYTVRTLICWLYIVPLVLTTCLLGIYLFTATQSIYLELVHKIDAWPKGDFTLYPLMFIYGVIFYLCSRIQFRTYLKMLLIAVVAMVFWGMINSYLYDSFLPVNAAPIPSVLFVLNSIATVIALLIFLIRAPEFFLSKKIGIHSRSSSFKTGLLLYLGVDLSNPKTIKYFIWFLLKYLALITVASIAYYYIGTIFFELLSESKFWLSILSFTNIEGEIAFGFLLIVIPSVLYFSVVRRESYFLVGLFTIGFLVFSAVLINYQTRVSDDSVSIPTIGALIAVLCTVGAIFIDILIREKERLLAHSARTATEAINTITDFPPALFLRSFRDDGHTIWSSRLFERISSFSSTRYFAGQTIEQLMFYKCMWKFPIIALENPHIKHITNLSVENATQHNWRVKISDHMSAARIIFLFLGDTNNIRWELDLILNCHTDKLILILPPNYQSRFFIANSFPRLAMKIGISDKDTETSKLNKAKIVTLNDLKNTVKVYKCTNAYYPNYETALEVALSDKLASASKKISSNK